jgi:hypothetical protein
VLYEKLVKPAFVDWKELGAHYVVSSLFEPYPDRARVYCYDVQQEDHHMLESGKTKLVTGRARLTSVVTWETAVMSFGAVHFGDHYVNAGVREYLGEDAYRGLLENVTEPFERGDLPQVIRVFDQHFGESNYSLRSLFRDEQRRILKRILSSTVESAEAAYRQLYDQHAPTIRFIADLGIPAPRALSAAAEVVLNGNLRDAFEKDDLDMRRINGLLNAARVDAVTLDPPTLAFALQGTLEHLADRLFQDPANVASIQKLLDAIELTRSLPFRVEIWKVQNGYYRLLQRVYQDFETRAQRGDESAKEWVRLFTLLGEKLAVNVESVRQGLVPSP